VPSDTACNIPFFYSGGALRISAFNGLRQGDMQCGTCVSVQNTASGGKSTVVMLVDLGGASFDLAKEAFDAIDNPGKDGYANGHLSIDYTVVPCDGKTNPPTSMPTSTPTDAPTDAPSGDPTEAPTLTPTEEPVNPTETPTEIPTQVPTQQPENPTDSPTNDPSNAPTKSPTRRPKRCKTKRPKNSPTAQPSSNICGCTGGDCPNGQCSNCLADAQGQKVCYLGWSKEQCNSAGNAYTWCGQ